MSTGVKIILAAGATLILFTGAAAAYKWQQQARSSSQVAYTLTASASEQCTHTKGEKIFVNEPCQIFLDAQTLGEDPNLTVNWYEITDNKKLLVSDQDVPFFYSFAVKKEDNGIHRYQAELIKDQEPLKVVAVSNVIEVEVNIIEMGCEHGGKSWANIPDENLKKAIRDAIAKETNTDLIEQVDCAVFGSLKKLDASRKNIHSLVGLEHAISLVELNLSENAIADFSQIGVLKNLTSLNLNNTGLSDIGFMTGLIELKELYLGNNNIKNIDVLSRLPKLTVISLGKNAIENISALGTFANVSAGSLFTVVRNPLDWSADSNARKIVTELKQKGVTVDFDNLSVSLVSKPAGANIQVEEKTNIEFTAKGQLQGSTQDATITKIELFENGKFLSEMTGPLYKYILPVKLGTNEYFSKVTTNDGAFAKSSKIIVVGEKKKEQPKPSPTPEIPVITLPTTSINLPPVNEVCMTPYVYCDPGDPEHNVPASCAFGLENASCGIPIVICDGSGCYKDDPQKTPFNFEGCPELKNFMKPGPSFDVSGSRIPLPANKTCGGENFCKRILLCAK